MFVSKIYSKFTIYQSVIKKITINIVITALYCTASTIEHVRGNFALVHSSKATIEVRLSAVILEILYTVYLQHAEENY